MEHRKENLFTIKNRLEKSFIYSKDTEVQKNICKYLDTLHSIAFTKLLQDGTTVEERSVLTGELRVIQKLIDVLGTKVEPMLMDLSA